MMALTHHKPLWEHVAELLLRAVTGVLIITGKDLG